MSIYGRGRRQRQEASTNIYWNDIERCNRRLEELERQDPEHLEEITTPKDRQFLIDLKRRGSVYQLTEGQMRYFSAVARKLYR